MNELIPLHPQTIDGNAVETVNARELHAFVESKQDFSTWIKNRIYEYDFVESQDYVKLAENKAPQKNGAEKSMTYDNWQGRIEYFVSVGMAKELSMVERNDKGKQARRYFIECEKQLHEQIANPVPTPTPPVAGGLEDKMRAFAFVLTQFKIDDIAREALLAGATEEVLEVKLPYRPKLERRTYTATKIGEKLGISANKVGRITNVHGLKVPEYGIFVLDKARQHDKNVENFRYYSNVIPVIQALL